MVKRYELGSDWGGCDGSVTCMVEDPTGEYVLHDEHAKALALIAEMKDVVYTAAGKYPFDTRDDEDMCMGLAARAEELLRD